MNRKSIFAILFILIISVHAPAQWKRIVKDLGAVGRSQMVYDPERKVVVMKAGLETWELKGKKWDLKSLDSPVYPWFDSALVYDGNRRKVLYYGQISGEKSGSRTWEWDGTSWQLKSRKGPSPRSNFALAYHPGRNTVVLFGGFDLRPNIGVKVLDDTWEWDGKSWRQLDIEGPTARVSHVMGSDYAHGTVVLRGGADGPGTNNLTDTWIFNTSKWVRAKKGKLPALQIRTLVFDSAKNALILFDQNTLAPPKMYEWTGLEWNLIPADLPADLAELGIAFDGRGKRWIFHGRDEKTLIYNNNRVTRFGKVWPQIGNVQIGLVYDPDRDKVIVHGYSRRESNSNSREYRTYEWNGKKWKYGKTVVHYTQVISGPMLYYPPLKKTVIVSASAGEDRPPATMWLWNGSSWKSRAIGNPELEKLGSGFEAVYDSNRRTIVLFGGRRFDEAKNEWEYVSETWEFDGSGWKLLSTEGPEAHIAFSMAYDAKRGKVVLFGGLAGPVFPLCRLSSETWEWDGEHWELVSRGRPSKREQATMFYDENREETVLIGGSNETFPYFNDVWTWNGESWKRIGKLFSKSGFFSGAATYHSGKKRILIFGGFVDMNNDFWEIGPEINPPSSVEDITIENR